MTFPSVRDMINYRVFGGGVMPFLWMSLFAVGIVAADQVGAGPGDRVLLVSGTVAGRYCMDAPVDAAVVAILDREDKHVGP